MERLSILNQHIAPKKTAWVLQHIVPFEFNEVGILKGKTLFISGASRGIGLAIALRAARDGANIAIVAKTVTDQPTLPGTIYTAANEIEQAGGKALAIQCDIRDEESVKNAVELTVKTFGGIDILINNASAISLTSTEYTKMKVFDLMHQINTRGTFMCSKYCIPYLKKAKNPHIINIAPPLSMLDSSLNYFEPHVAYTIAKFGMTLCAFGMSAELKDYGIGVNTLWPRTSIDTSAVKNILGGLGMIDKSRTPEIMADSAYIILTSDSKLTTGNFFKDDEVLASKGITDLSKYRVNPNISEQDLVPDFFN